MTQLSVNLNKVALLRNQRDVGVPDVLSAARTAVAAGAYGITVHPRPDERHIRYSDVYDLAELIRGEFEGVEFNIEGNPFGGRLMEILRDVKPDQATLVPDTHDQATSDHGWDLAREDEKLKGVVDELKSLGGRVSLFMDPDCEQIRRAKDFAADRIELYTEPYAKACAQNADVDAQLKRYAEAAQCANECGLGVNAGHDLNLHNLGLFISAVPGVLEVSIGHALISDALTMGLGKAVEEYLRVLAENE